MKKISGLLIVAMIAFTLMTGAAFAGTITTTLQPNVLTYPAEAAKSGTVTVNLQTGAFTRPRVSFRTVGLPLPQQNRFYYAPGTLLPATTRIIFHLATAHGKILQYFLLDL